MRWIDKLERRWGRYGIPNLMNIILVGQLIAWVKTRNICCKKCSNVL